MAMGGRTVWNGKSRFREKLKCDEEQKGRTRRGKVKRHLGERKEHDCGKTSGLG